jgi:hypothetical protein
VNCRDIDDLLITGAELTADARRHVSECAACQLLLASSQSQPVGPPDSEVLARIQGHIGQSLESVQPIASSAVYACAFVLISAVIGVAGAKLFGLQGWPVLTAPERAVILTVLAGAILLGALGMARDMRPGSPSVRGWVVFAAAFVGIEAVFVALFHDYSPGDFVRRGMICLRAGVACAIPAGLLMWLLLRRGYVVAPVSTGIAVGTAAGLAGVTALELHCGLLTVPHVAIWHAGVLVVSGVLGAGAGWFAGRRQQASVARA